MRYYFDTEFQDDGCIIDLISIGIVAQDGRELYLVSEEYDESRATDWLKTRVLNHIPSSLKRRPRQYIASSVADFLAGPGLWDDAELPEIWGWYCAYDWVALCQLYGPMLERPAHFPKRANDLRQLLPDHWERPRQSGTKHNALEDARWVQECHREYIRQTRDREIAELRLEPGLFSSRKD